MRLAVPVTALISALALGACSGAETPAGVQVQAQQSVLVTDEPLGDVVSHELEAGDRATALCFVGAASTNTGARGTAVRIEAGRRIGYASTTDFPDDPSDRRMVFDLSEDELRERLPACE